MKALAPAPQAVTAADFKAAVHILHADDDALIDSYLAAAQEVVEGAAGRPMGKRAVEFVAPGGAWRRWWFPVAPVDALTAVGYLDVTGNVSALVLSDFVLENGFDEPVLVLPEGHRSSAAGDRPLIITADVGVWPSGLPLGLRQAVILLAKEWFEAGIAVDAAVEQGMSFGARALIRQRRYKRPLVVA